MKRARVETQLLILFLDNGRSHNALVGPNTTIDDLQMAMAAIEGDSDLQGISSMIRTSTGVTFLSKDVVVAGVIGGEAALYQTGFAAAMKRRETAEIDEKYRVISKRFQEELRSAPLPQSPKNKPQTQQNPLQPSVQQQQKGKIKDKQKEKRSDNQPDKQKPDASTTASPSKGEGTGFKSQAFKLWKSEQAAIRVANEPSASKESNTKSEWKSAIKDAWQAMEPEERSSWAQEAARRAAAAAAAPSSAAGLPNPTSPKRVTGANATSDHGPGSGSGSATPPSKKQRKEQPKSTTAPVPPPASVPPIASVSVPDQSLSSSPSSSGSESEGLAARKGAQAELRAATFSQSQSQSQTQPQPQPQPQPQTQAQVKSQAQPQVAVSNSISQGGGDKSDSDSDDDKQKQQQQQQQQQRLSFLQHKSPEMAHKPPMSRPSQKMKADKALNGAEILPPPSSAQIVPTPGTATTMVPEKRSAGRPRKAVEVNSKDNEPTSTASTPASLRQSGRKTRPPT